MSKKVKTELTALPLGGVGECGSLNMMVYECDGEMIVVDAGMGFPHQYTPGIDSIIPDITYIRDNIDKLKGIFITHAHEDHIGALHYLYEDMKAPVYCTKFTRLILEEKFESVDLLDELEAVEVQTGDKVKVGNMEVEFVGLTHSIPESHALMIRSKHGNIFHTGDYKFEDVPPVGAVGSVERLKEIGEEGVLALFGDSTSVTKKGHSGNETHVATTLQQLVAGCQNRIYFCTITSQIARTVSAIEAAIANGRKIAVFGRSLQRRIENGKACGYITKEMSSHFIDIMEAKKLPKDKVFIMVTGAQGQSRAALGRLAWQDVPQMTLSPGDDVIHSSLWIPGNEKEISNMVSGLTKKGAKVHHMYNNPGIYASGHPSQDDVIEMYKLIKPEIVIPVHGDFEQMHANAKVAKQAGVPRSIVFEDGYKIHLGPEEAYVEDMPYPQGRNYVDGYNILDQDRFIMKDRVKISEAGVAIVTIVIEEQTGKLAANPQVTTKGLIDEKVQSDVMELVESNAYDALMLQFTDGVIAHEQHAKQTLIQSVRKSFLAERGRKPVVLPVIVTV